MTAGSLTLEACVKGIGRYIEAALGTVTSTLVSGSTYQQVHTPATTDPLKSHTIQKGVPPIGGGTTLAHTFTGMMCDKLSIDAPNGEIVTITTEWIGKDITTATAYAAPSYPTLAYPFHHGHMSATLGGAVTPPTTTALATGGTAVTRVRSFSCEYANNLDGEGFNSGGAGKRNRKQLLGKRELTGTLEVEFDSVTDRDAFLAQTDTALTVTWTGDTALSTGFVTLQVVIPVALSLSFVGLRATPSSTPFYIVLRTSDTAV
jgi:hypothetical protein